jgi:hypothetical protein
VRERPERVAELIDPVQHTVRRGDEEDPDDGERQREAAEGELDQDLGASGGHRGA